MAFNSNGQVQYLILDSLQDGSKYGLEIIEFISKKTDGGYLLKKPTLYSCLTRLEKKGFVSSSFWGESEFGGKRHYYALTDAGRESLNLLEKEFANVTFTSDSNREVEFTENEIRSESEEITEEKPIFLEQKNLFDFTSPKQEEQKKPIEEQKEPEVADNQIDFFSYEPPKEEPKDDAVFLPKNETLTVSQIEQNKKIYDTSSELKRYRNRRSFSDNQIAMPMQYEEKESEEDFKSKIDSLKQSMLQARQNNFDKEAYASLFKKDEPEKQEEFYTKEPDITSSEIITEMKEQEDVKDDAVLITSPKFDDESIPYQKKITPPNLEINVSDDNLPAPIRDSKLEPTYNDMMSKIQEKKKEKEIIEKNQAKIYEEEKSIVTQSLDSNATFADYNSLRNYYQNYGIEFKEYKKSSVERIHNTNLLNLIISSILLLLSGIGSAVLYGIISATNLLMASSNFLYYTIPIIFAVYTIYCGIKYKVMVSKKASIKYNAVTCWAVFILATVIVFVINVCCGMQAETMNLYLTSLLVPILALFLILPVNYHITKFVYKRYAK